MSVPRYFLDYVCPVSLADSLEEAMRVNFSGIVVPLFHPGNKRNLLNLSDHSLDDSITRSDLALTSMDQWSQHVIGKLSRWIHLDAIDACVRNNAELAFLQEISWANHLHLEIILLPPLVSRSLNNYARMVNQVLHAQNHFLFPICLSSIAALDDADDPWEVWNAFRMHCSHNANLGVCLEINGDLPTISKQDRWLGEPIRMIVLAPSLFISNKKGYPILSKPYAEFVFRLMRKCGCNVILKAPFSVELALYLDYLNYLSNYIKKNETQLFEEPFYDFLQSPLQPLSDNLNAGTYEVFEKDPVKYVAYEEAVYLAITKRQINVVMVVGAGRGPLVDCVLRAASRAMRTLTIFAVEKNPNAIITLKGRKKAQWGDSVSIISSDMRIWNPPVLADLIVSELLGSFGDNELSPECLDGAQRLLKGLFRFSNAFI